jgi:membrane protease subunit (stomatin/prohibitin family)
MPKLMEVLEFLDNSGHIMVKGIPEKDYCEIKWGAQLTVRESQVAIFFRDGRELDTFGPGRYVLQTENIPLVGKWVTSFGYGPLSPFRAEVYFINMKLFPNLKWGTKEPILFKDAELNMIRLRSYGIFSIQITDPSLFLNKVVGTQGVYEDINVEEYLRNIIIPAITEVIGKNIKTVFNMPSDFTKLSIMVQNKLQLDFEGLGLALHDIYINSISVPPEVQQLIDTKSGMSALGSMDDFIKFKTAMALESAAENPNGTGSAGVGIGAGLGMGLMLPSLLQQAMQNKQKVNDIQNETPIEKIKKLKELFDLGAITKEEFETKKKKLMEEI